jgi:hypothetical protein
MPSDGQAGLIEGEVFLCGCGTVGLLGYRFAGCMKKLHGSYGTVVEHVGMAISYLSLFSSGKVLLSVI